MLSIFTSINSNKTPTIILNNQHFETDIKVTLVRHLTNTLHTNTSQILLEYVKITKTMSKQKSFSSMWFLRIFTLAFNIHVP